MSQELQRWMVAILMRFTYQGLRFRLTRFSFLGRDTGDCQVLGSHSSARPYQFRSVLERVHIHANICMYLYRYHKQRRALTSVGGEQSANQRGERCSHFTHALHEASTGSAEEVLPKNAGCLVLRLARRLSRTKPRHQTSPWRLACRYTDHVFFAPLCRCPEKKICVGIFKTRLSRRVNVKTTSTMYVVYAAHTPRRRKNERYQATNISYEPYPNKIVKLCQSFYRQPRHQMYGSELEDKTRARLT